MKLVLCIVVIVILSITGCSSNNATTPVQENIVLAYDTIEIRYQQLSELAFDVIDNVESDDSINVKKLYDLLDNVPSVNLDFNDKPASKKDIQAFIQYQGRIENELMQVFAQLDSSGSWRNAPFIQDMKRLAEETRKEIAAARQAYNKAVEAGKFDMKIPD